jgi:hypothetical protein
VYSQLDGCVSPSNCSIGLPYYYDAVVGGGQLFGIMLFAVGMTLYGVAALRHQALPRWNGAPALLGLLALLVVASYFVAMRAHLGADDAGVLRLELVYYVEALLLAAAWIALGVALFPRKEERAAPQAIPANGSVG